MNDIPCIAFALAGGSCCLNRQIVLTLGDVRRISACAGHYNFFVMEKPEPWYLDPFYDPAWLTLVLNPEGLFRVLKRNPDKSCGMLTKTGCILPFEFRPLVCQLHPYMYTETEIIGIDETCPISKEADGFTILERLNMPMGKAIGWQHLLYNELHTERNEKTFSPLFKTVIPQLTNRGNYTIQEDNHLQSTPG
ncbi:YkgJ family cysteine cluster protein [uncultured Desulfobacter sp.]|uniref:YkgJ family cysteine cluster protein n=1 Tax=uncultured Desulfobacter sp. TaxID=240139 RepID=UPI002AA9259A|nr:YkgJ family cysteine cluster protein [uncultured Desulfobacter sp.]